jgi:hypothetical protein
MFNYSSNKINSCDCDEVNRLRQENERLYEEKEIEREARRQEYRKLAEQQNRSVKTWRAALVKQFHLYSGEARNYPYKDKNGIDSFAVAAQACQEAVKFWDEIEVSKEEEIKELESRLEVLKDSIRLETCNKVRKLYQGKPEEKVIESYICSSLEEGGDPSDWLD